MKIVLRFALCSPARRNKVEICLGGIIKSGSLEMFYVIFGEIVCQVFSNGYKRESIIDLVEYLSAFAGLCYM